MIRTSYELNKLCFPVFAVPMTSRNFTFTYFNKELDLDGFGIHAVCVLEKAEACIKTKYIHFQLERCPDTKRLHFQGFIVLRSSSRIPAVVKLLAGVDLRGSHIENIKGSLRDNIAYCSKDETRLGGPWMAGDRPKGSGFRSDLANAIQTFNASQMSIRTLAKDHPEVFIKFSKGFKELKLALTVYPNDEKPEVYWYYGPTGTGKSFRCRERAPDGYRLAPPIGTKNLYFYGYNGETDIIFEDYNGYGGFRWLLVFLSEGRLICNASGHGVAVRRTRVFINSDRHPQRIFPEVFAEHPNLWAQLRRRITTIYHCTVPFGDSSFAEAQNSVAMLDQGSSEGCDLSGGSLRVVQDLSGEGQSNQQSVNEVRPVEPVDPTSDDDDSNAGTQDIPYGSGGTTGLAGFGLDWDPLRDNYP